MGKFQSFINTIKLITVEPYLFLCLFNFMIRMVSYQSLLVDRACSNLYNYDDEICNNLETPSTEQAKSVQAGNNLFMAISLMCSLPAVIIATLLGPWSDKYTRKYPLIIAAAGLVLESISCAILTAFPSVSPIWYVITSGFAGFSGGFIVSASGAFSYLADITDERSRPTRYALLEFASISSIVMGNLVGGQLFKLAGYTAVMATSPCFAVCALLYAIFILKETKPEIPKENRSAIIKDLFRTDNVKDSFKTCTQKRPGNLRLQLWLLIWTGFAHRFVEMGAVSIEFPYSKVMYQWDVTSFSNAGILYAVINALVMVTLVPLLSKVLKLHEAAIGVIGVLSLMAEMVLFSVAYEAPMFIYALISGTMNNFTTIAIRSRISKLVRADETGRAFSFLATCESLTPMLGTIVFIQTYNASVFVYPGLPFAAAAIFLIPSLLIFRWLMKMPTVSLAEFAIAEEQAKYQKPLQTISSNFAVLQDDRFREENCVPSIDENKRLN